jgi:hypothetical protein
MIYMDLSTQTVSVTPTTLQMACIQCNLYVTLRTANAKGSRRKGRGGGSSKGDCEKDLHGEFVIAGIYARIPRLLFFWYERRSG